MCFTVSVERKAKEAIEQFVKSNVLIQNRIDFEEDYYFVSGFSHPSLPLIKQNSVELSEWGLIPSFVNNEEKALDIRDKTLNARSDTIHEKVSFKSSIRSQRAVLPLDGFFEWKHVGRDKVPHYIFPRDEKVFYLGCIYNPWTNRHTGEIINTFSIITTDANPMMEVIHNSKKRMPLILSRDDIKRWNDLSTEIDEVNSLMKPYPESEMSAYQVSKDAGNSRINRNHPGIKERVENTFLF